MRYFFFLIIWIPICISAQSSFTNVYGSTHNEIGQVIKTVPSGGFVIGGYSINGGAGGWDIALTRIADDGNLLWCKKYGTANQEAFKDLSVNGSQGYYILSDFSRPQQGGAMVNKLDTNGNMFWTRIFPETRPFSSQCITSTSDGGFIFSLYVDSVNSTGWGSVRIVRCNSTGAILWARAYDAPPAYVYSITECPNGDFIVAGDILMRLDANGILLWAKFVGSSIIDMAWLNNSLIFLSRDYTSQGQFYATISSCTPAGVPNWSVTIQDSALNIYAHKMAIGPNGLISIVANDFDNAVQGNYVIQIDSNGVIQNSYSLPATQGMYFIDITTAANELALTGIILSTFSPTDSGSVVLVKGEIQNLCGQTPINLTATNDSLTMSTINISSIWSGYGLVDYVTMTYGASVVNLCVVGIEESDESSALDIYPNPFSESIVVSSEDAVGGELVICSATGEEVKRTRISHEAETISCIELAAGIYFYRIESNNEIISTGKLIKE